MRKTGVKRIAFTSGRTYGNAQVGTAGHERRQIWVTAIRSDAAAGEDHRREPHDEGHAGAEDQPRHHVASQMIGAKAEVSR